MEIKVLARQGTPKTEIARRLGVSRRRSSKLDPFKEYIQIRLEDFDVPATNLRCGRSGPRATRAG